MYALRLRAGFVAELAKSSDPSDDESLGGPFATTGFQPRGNFRVGGIDRFTVRQVGLPKQHQLHPRFVSDIAGFARTTGVRAAGVRFRETRPPAPDQKQTCNNRCRSAGEKFMRRTSPNAGKRDRKTVVTSSRRYRRIPFNPKKAESLWHSRQNNTWVRHRKRRLQRFGVPHD